MLLDPLENQADQMQDAEGPLEVEPVKKDETLATPGIPKVREILVDAKVKAIEGANSPVKAKKQWGKRMLGV